MKEFILNNCFTIIWIIGYLITYYTMRYYAKRDHIWDWNEFSVTFFINMILWPLILPFMIIYIITRNCKLPKEPPKWL